MSAMQRTDSSDSLGILDAIQMCWGVRGKGERLYGGPTTVNGKSVVWKASESATNRNGKGMPAVAEDGLSALSTVELVDDAVSNSIALTGADMAFERELDHYESFFRALDAFAESASKANLDTDALVETYQLVAEVLSGLHPATADFVDELRLALAGQILDEARGRHYSERL